MENYEKRKKLSDSKIKDAQEKIRNFSKMKKAHKAFKIFEDSKDFEACRSFEDFKDYENCWLNNKVAALRDKEKLEKDITKDRKIFKEIESLLQDSSRLEK